MIFWDTSALVRCYSPLEVGHERAKNFLLSEKGNKASALIEPELTSAIVRRLGRDKRNRESLLAEIKQHLEYFDLVNVGDDQIAKANALVRTYFLKALDALHLASALSLSRELGQKRMVFLTGDADQASAARAERFKVIEL